MHIFIDDDIEVLMNPDCDSDWDCQSTDCHGSGELEG
jgi:hypothetical protein